MPARRALLRLTWNFRCPYSKAPPVPTNANADTANTRCAATQSWHLSNVDFGGRKVSEKNLGFGGGGRMDAGIHDCLDKASRMDRAAFSTWLSIEFARSLEYFVTLVGTQANYI